MYDLEEPEFSLKYGFRIIDEQAALMEFGVAIEARKPGSITSIDLSIMKYSGSRQVTFATA